MTAVEVLGIRHHGPGSARSVLSALEELRPDLVLIEGAPELNALVASSGHEELVPPVAALTYDIATPRRSMFYPLASFSPEWVALRWAVAAGVEVRFADLPAVHLLAEVNEPADESAEQPANEAGDEFEDEAGEESDDEDAVEEDGFGDDEVDDGMPRRPDVIAMLAEVAGYDDPERWWEDAIEHRHDTALADFASLRELIRLARESIEHDDVENDRREASMRKEIRAAIRQGKERVAFVCGAFHAPALDPASFPSQAADNKLLAKLPKTKVEVTWAPWTAARLSHSSGYGAGVTSPGWYAHLFEQWQAGSTDTSTTWLVKLAQLLRSKDLDAPPASVVEAARVADTLAALRGRPAAGLSELTDATLTTLLGGHTAPLAVIHDELVVGRELGSVPPDTPMVPLAADLVKQTKALRLKRAAVAAEVMLDLRTPGGLARSQLFHRLNAIGVDWATAASTGRTTGTFKEAWQLAWLPEFEVSLIEAGLYGSTVSQAAAAMLIKEGAEADSLARLSALLEQALLCELPEALTALVRQVDTQAAQHSDVTAMLAAIEPLARTLRYGDVRGLEVSGLDEVVAALVRRACVGLRSGCQNLDDDASAAMRLAIEGADRGLGTLDVTELSDLWSEALSRVGADAAIHGQVSGRVNRLLLDAGQIEAEEAGRRMSLRLSVAASAIQSAAWLDGFLSGEAILLLEELDLLRLLDEWVAQVTDETFEDLLPLLRRTFSRFQAPERRQLGQRITRLDAPDSHREALQDWDLEAARQPLQRVAALLGLTLAGAGTGEG